MTKYLEEKGKTDLEKQDREENEVVNPMSFCSPFESVISRNPLGRPEQLG